MLILLLLSVECKEAMQKSQEDTTPALHHVKLLRDEAEQDNSNT